MGEYAGKNVIGGFSCMYSEFNPPRMWTDAKNMIYLRYHDYEVFYDK